MASIERRAREKAEVQGKILNAARELFIREGFESVSLRKVAEAIEYTPPAIYTHFKDKTELLKALCREDFGRLSETIIKVSKIADPIQRIMKIGQMYIRFAVEHPHHYRFMFMTPLPRELEPDADELAEKDDPERNGYAALRQAVDEVSRAGLFRPEFRDPELGAQVLWAGVHGIASLDITFRDDPFVDFVSLERRSRAMCEALLRGMLSDPALVPHSRAEAKK